MQGLSIRQLVAARNREIMIEAALSFVLGVVFTVVTCALLFWLTWYVCHFWLDWGRGPVIAGLVAVCVYLLVATFSAWRNVDPLQAIAYDPNYSGSSKAGLSMMTGLPIVDRHGIAAAGAALIAGPLNIFEGIADLRRRLPTDGAALDAAQWILQQAQRELKLSSELNADAVALLHRLALIKVRNAGAGPVIMLTAKGLEALRS